MGMKTNIAKVLVVFMLALCWEVSLVYAEGLESVGFFTGYMTGDLKNQDDYEGIPLMAAFGFDLKPLAEKIGIRTKGILEFQVEPYISSVIEPSTEVETGVGFMFKYAFPLSESFMPYLKIGSGPAYMTLHTREQGTQFNFVSSGCAGFSWFFKEDASLDCEYRMRHLSNCGIDDPNGGINTEAVLVGMTFRFE